jgi:hypothetical protein
MSESHSPLPPDVRALLDRERELPQVPASVRTRALARARAALVAGIPASTGDYDPAPRPRWIKVGASVCVAVATAAIVYQLRAARAPHESARPSPSHATQIIASPPPETATPSTTIAPSPLGAAPSNRSARTAQVVPGPEELRLLRQARAAVARGDFTAALSAIAEHARRFKDARLTEEREALRVRALSGLGRNGEARRAADAFAARFPRSVLLPAVRQMPGPPP